MFVLTVSVVLISLLAVTPFYIYDRFNQQQAIAKIEFTKQSDQVFLAHLYKGSFCYNEDFQILGDQVQLDASFLKWNGWAVLLGFESLYRLDRLSGRYRKIEDQKTKAKSYHDLATEVVFDAFTDKELQGESSWIVDSQYGSSVYIDIRSDLIYKIYKTEDGLVAKSELRPELEKKEGVLIINIENPCAENNNSFGTVAKEINDIVLRIF